MSTRRLTEEELRELEGKQFGRLTVISYDHCEKKINYTGYRYYYLCECSCQNKTRLLVNRGSLLFGSTQSCGCLQKEIATNIIRNESYKHGVSVSDKKFYKTWLSMKQRCSKKYCQDYLNYGGRGIGVDFLWMDFINFYNDMYPSYLEHCAKYGPENTSLDRIDVNDMYCKENCRWATREEQMNNRRVSRKIEYKGNLYTCRELLNNFPHDESVTINVLHDRIFRTGTDIEKALTMPKRKINLGDEL